MHPLPLLVSKATSQPHRSISTRPNSNAKPEPESRRACQWTVAHWTWRRWLILALSNHGAMEHERAEPALLRGRVRDALEAWTRAETWETREMAVD